MKLILDAMGGDNAPGVICEAAVAAVNEMGVEICLVGKESEITPMLEGRQYNKTKLTVVNADEVISNEEEPAMAVRRKKNSSIVVAANMLKNGEGDCLLSCGSTGALLAASLLIVGRLKGVLRPAIAAVLPSKKGRVMLIDSGANTNCKPENLVQFAIMGSVYMNKLLAVDNPKVGLLSNGSEEGKGDELTKAAYEQLKSAPVNFVGNIEGREITDGNHDVIVCDGFVGNVALKTIEGVGALFAGVLKGLFKKNFLTKIASITMMDGIRDFKKLMDYRETGGAPLLGIKKPVIKGHGSSDVKAVLSAIRQANSFCSAGVIETVAGDISKLTGAE